jgi:hypothetical protein
MADAARGSLLVEYEKCFPVHHAATKLELQQMSKYYAVLHAASLKPKKRPEKVLTIDEHIHYAVALCRFSHAICTKYPRMYSSAPLWWKHGDHVCNCIYFEVVRRGLDAARRFLGQTMIDEKKRCAPDGDSKTDASQRYKLIAQARTLIGVLKHIRDEVIPEWTDAPPEATIEPYSSMDAETLSGFLRAYALWCHATLQASSVPRSSSAIQPSDALRTIARMYGASHAILSKLPSTYELHGGDNEAYHNHPLDNRSTRPFDVPPAKGKPSEKRREELKERTWTQGAHLDFLMAASKWFWTLHTGKSVACLRLAWFNGEPLPESELAAKESEQSTNYQKLNPKPALSECEALLETELKHSEYTTMHMKGCNVLPDPSKAAGAGATGSDASANCSQPKCGAHAFEHEFDDDFDE